MESSHFESTFPKDYRKADIEGILKFVLAGKFCQLICLPGGGKATVLKLLSANSGLKTYHLKEKADSTLFFYLNLLELPDFEQTTIDRFLLLSFQQEAGNETIEQWNNDPIILSEKLKEIINQIINNNNQTLVLFFDHFDEFQNRLDRQFFQRLRSLRSLGKYRFSVVFATRRDLCELIDEQIRKEFYDFFVGNTVYMKLYDKEVCSFIISQIENVLGKKLTKTQKEGLIALTCGHTKLLKVCAENVLQEGTEIKEVELLQKPIIRACLFELWLFLTPQEQQILASSKLASSDQLESYEFLKNIGLLKDGKFTIPLFAEFVKQVVPTLKKEEFFFIPETREIIKGNMVVSDLLSPLEFRLLKFLIENKERIIERDEIIGAVWKDTKSTEGVTDQALDQLIFRLRQKIEDDPNNPTHLQTVKGRGVRFVS